MLASIVLNMQLDTKRKNLTLIGSVEVVGFRVSMQKRLTDVGQENQTSGKQWALRIRKFWQRFRTLEGRRVFNDIDNYKYLKISM